MKAMMTLALVSILCVSAVTAVAQTPGAVDPTFDPGHVEFGFGTASVFKVLRQPDGKILIGGAFSTVQGASRNSLARLNADGTLDTTFVPPFVVAATIPFVANIVPYPDGRLLVSGSGLNVVGGPVPYSIVRLNPDGSLDPTFTLQGMAVSRGVEGLALLPDGRILIGGDFSNIGPATIRTIARLNADGTLDPTFDLEPTTDGYGGRVVSIVLQPDGNILAGGELVLTVGPTRVSHMARIRPDASVDTTFRPVFNANEGPVVRSIALRPDGSMYIGGAFSSIDGVTKVSVARLTAAGALDPSFDVFGSTPADIRDVLLQASGKLLITGNFFIPGDRRAIARVDSLGAIDFFAPPDGLGPGGIGYSLDVQPDGKVLVGGSFFQVGGLPRERVVRFLDGPPPNAAPTANDDAATTAEDTPVTVSVLANDLDPDGDPLTITAVTPAAHGGVAIAGGTVVYTPDPDSNGADAFTYTIDDGHAHTDTATVAVTVTAVNDAPVANDDAYVTPAGATLTIAAPGVLANDADPEGAPLGAALVSPPATGALGLNPDGSFVYVPAAGFIGTATFTYAASDGAASSNVATVTIAVTPTMMKVAASLDPLPGGGGVFTGFPKGPSVSGRLVSFLGLGTAGQQGVYGCDTAIPTDPCVRVADRTTAIPGGTGTFAAFQAASAAGPLTGFIGTGAGQAGVYACGPGDPCVPVANLGTNVPGGTGTFTGFAGLDLAADAFRPDPAPVAAFIGNGGGQQGVYACLPGDPCQPVADRTTQIPGGTGTFAGFTDLGLTVPFQPDPPPMVAFIGSGAGQQGVYACDRAIPTDPCVPVADRGTPIPGGSGTFTGFVRVAVAKDVSQRGAPVVAFIGTGGSQAGVYACMPGDPCAPIANLGTAIPGGTGTFTGFTAVSTSRGHTAFLGQGANGQAGLYVASTLTKVVALGDTLDGRVVAALRLERDGLDGNRLGFAATFTDGSEGVFIAGLNVGGNADPVASDDTAATSEDAAVTVAVLANDADPDGDPLSVTAAGPAAHGSVSHDGATVTYTPAANFHGTDTFGYTISDGQGGTATATVTVQVAAANDPPVAAGDAYTVGQDATLTVPAPGVLANDADPDGDPLSALLASGAAHGQLSLSPSGAFVYVPAPGYNGPDAFSYRASDGHATSNLATVTLTVTPATPAIWRPTGSLSRARAGHTATLLRDGRVLVVGGAGAPGSPTTAELYDPASATWTSAGSTSRPHVSHTATLLPDGRVLVAGSGARDFSGAAAASAEIFDPATGAWTPTGSMNRGHASHTATLLSNGKVLVAGGSDVANLLQPSPTELFDPVTGTWSLASQMPAGRIGHQATLLADGRVLVAGGVTVSPVPSVLRRTDIYDPATGAWTQTGDLTVRRTGHTATLLSDGRVLVAGGTGAASSPSTAERYDPGTGGWTPAANLSPRALHTAALLPDGNVLVAAGLNAAGLPSRTAGLFVAAAGTWGDAAPLGTPRVFHTMTVLADGRVLVTGGLSGLPALRSAEVYGP